MLASVKALSTFSPQFFSVTHGAIGNAVAGTYETVEELTQLGHTVAPHITSKVKTEEGLERLIAQYQKIAVRHAVIIKGDINDHESSDFEYSSALLKSVRRIAPEFSLAVASYPEFHPHGTVAKDLVALKEKEQLGADIAITQFFYNIDAYYAFLDLLARNNITIPIVVGVLPIIQFKTLCSFAAKCGADIPRWLVKQMQHYEHDHASMRQLGIDLLTTMMDSIRSSASQFKGFHLYSLNQHEVIEAILTNLSYPKADKSDT